MNAQQLKNSILQMAVQGKLVPQDPNDEPASVLLERIRAEKAAMVKAGKIKKEKNLSVIFRGEDNLFYEQVGNGKPVCIADELPFEIPDSWELARLSMVCQLVDGKKQATTLYPIIDAKLLRSKGEISFSDSGKFVSKDMKVILVDGENSGEVFTVPQDGYMGSTFKILWLSSEVYEPYVLDFIELYRIPLKNSKRGAAIPHLNKNMFYSLLLPLPPIEEQRRIANILARLTPIIKNYDNVEHALKALNATFPAQLKKSILQQAVQGKLVPQDPNDEPASVLLARIRKEKERLIKEGKIKRDKRESVIYRRDNSHYEKVDGVERCIDEEIPFEIPESWEWVRLGSLLTKLSDGTHFTPKYVNTGVPFISVKDISFGKLCFDNCKYITDAEHKLLYSRCNPEFGDLLLTKVGTTGIPVIVDTEREFSLFVSVALLKFNKDMFYNRFLLYLIKSPLVQKQAAENTRGVGNKNWVIRDISNTLIVVPPHAEQFRIVSKIEQMLSICNKI